VLRERVAALRDAGYSQLAVQLVEGHEDALDDWAEVLRPLGLGKAAGRAKPAARKQAAPRKKSAPRKKRRR